MNRKTALVAFYDAPQIDRDSGSKSIDDFVTFLIDDGWQVVYLASNGLREPRYTRRLSQRGVCVFDGQQTPIEQLVSATGFDLALLCSWQIAELYLPALRNAAPETHVIVNSLDLHFLRAARRILRDAAARNGSAVLLNGDYAAEMTGELNVYAAADGVLTVSETEASLINSFTGDPALAHMVPDSEDYTFSPVPFSDRKGMLFMGSFLHPPNIDAVEFLCGEVLPLVDRKLLDEHPAYIVGAGLDERVRRHGRGRSDVRMVGWVPSIRPYFEQARISVVPLLYGAGTKRKLLQALLAGTPTVSTTVGAEGFSLQPGKHVLVADDPASFAESIERLLRSRRLWKRMAHAGSAHARRLHSPDAERRHFLDVISSVLVRKPKSPLLPEGSRRLYQRRLMYQYFHGAPAVHQTLLPELRRLVADAVPGEATVAVVTNGDDALLELEGRQAWHFPREPGGKHGGVFPADGAAAIAQLEAVRAQGADYLLVPETAFWWLHYYGELKEHLESHYTRIVSEDSVCHVYSLRNGARGALDREPVVVHQATREEPRPPGETEDARLIAFYLPQFHPIPENDAWWGPGFTEWMNVAAATPAFEGHYQPRLPADLGFYDLRMPEVRAAQADLAASHGIQGFCYYHYWFNGKRLLERPFNEVLRSGEPDFPFCLCWANEPWSRRWTGQYRDVLQPQEYSREDDLDHIRWLLPALADPRAVRIEGKPVFLVWRVGELPDPARMVETWRAEADRAGLGELYLMAMETGWDLDWSSTLGGFDATVLFQPNFTTLRGTPRTPVEGKDALEVYDYELAWPILADTPPVPYRRFDSVCTGWDNSARRGENATVMHNSTPEAYEEWLRHALVVARSKAPEHRVVFLNAWNEWAEGAYLEPDVQHGRAYLEATRRALDGKPPGLASDGQARVTIGGQSVRA